MTRFSSLSALAVLLAAAACGSSNKPAVDATVAADSLVFAVAGDSTSGPPGVLSVFDPTTQVMQTNVVASVAGDDPYVRLIKNDLYIINRSDGDNVTVLDSVTLALVEQLSTGASSNPQDVAVVGNKLYVPTLKGAGVAVIATGEPLKTIDLSSLDPIDNNPNCVSAYLVGTLLYVACDLLDDNDPNLTPRGPGKVAVIDTTTDTFETALTMTLPTANPQGMIQRAPADSTFAGDLLIPLVPSFTDYSTGCIARITPGTTPVANGCAINNSDLGGFAEHLSVQTADSGAETLWMAVGSYSSDFSMSFGNVRSYDLTGGKLAAAASSPPSELIVDVAACNDGNVVVADATTGTNGLRIYKGGSEVTTAPISIGLPPAFGNGLACSDNGQ